MLESQSRGNYRYLAGERGRVPFCAHGLHGLVALPSEGAHYAFPDAASWRSTYGRMPPCL